MNVLHKTIYTIGHSTRTLEKFLALLEAFSIKMLVDVRSYPGSKRYPHFNKEHLAKKLSLNNILYTHLASLGGRRKSLAHSKNSVWKNDAFRGYADYMETAEFKNGILELEDIAGKYNTAFMCSEAVWWRCHRSMIADYVKAEGWKVLHIINNKKAEEHPYTAPAKIIEGKLFYTTEQQDLF
ncbi:DUF488 domain-containing protein [Ginsengibacter hankyongi]|uniref:DUF488 domain-containing protein n=1 Tax=Ginsengibacter hankyongi TaxID=2607284 RepID=A0A5J5IL82_9BACT|nr:DUF488 domain-containing protein [Ginsengibacter hankyongi]KAA9041308.1 DUF488 domain-containing protein [Ginsengibacter hankyongi]